MKLKHTIDEAAILTPIADDRPAGESLRYTGVYDEIKEARRADDPLARGEWQRELKTSDWDKVVSLASQALAGRTKDLQITAWLTEGLVMTDGFPGLALGLRLMTALLRSFWDTVYPEVEDGDLEYRAAPFEFLNEKLWLCVKQIPLTDPASASVYPLLKWQESRQVGYEADTRNRYGDVDDEKKRVRDELIAEGKMTAEEFDAAVAASSKAYYEALMESVTACVDGFNEMDRAVDELFGSAAPRLSELGAAIGECHRVVARILKEKREREPAAEPAPPSELSRAPATASDITEACGESAGASLETRAAAGGMGHLPPSGFAALMTPPSTLPDGVASEAVLWSQAVQLLETAGIRRALEQLFQASCSAPSVRERSRYRLLMARLCLKAERPELARPIIEELHFLMEELHLERWESPAWIGEVLDAYYQCLTWGEPSDDDMERAKELFRRLCTTDVTRAMAYRR